MSIQVTPIPRLTVLTSPAFTLGTANAAGSAETAVASDSTLLAFDTTLPAAVGTAATGSATVAPRRDHVHSGVTALSSGVAKVWCQIAGNNTLRSPDYNVASVTSTGTGNRTIVYTVDFSTTVYSVVGAMNESDATGDHETWDTFAVDSVRNLVRNASGLVAQETGMAAFGDQ